MASASGLEETGVSCLEALRAGDAERFQALAMEIRAWRNVWDTKALMAASECLSEGYGEKWVYSAFRGQFFNEAEEAEKLKAAELKAERARQAERDKADRIAEEMRQLEMRRAKLKEDYKKNAALVSSLAYETCAKLLFTDKERALMNQVCLDKFTQFGLPKTE
ncbi:hypothetical protein ACEN2R_20775 [Pseudogemmobacter sp. W21_MBD1_M6]